MEIPEEIVQKWQAIWKQVCDMSYRRENITSIIYVPISEYTTLLEYRKHSTNFDKITLDCEWQKISVILDKHGDFLEALIVPELKEIYVPRILFEAIGVYPWFKHSFPNCTIVFWEDDLE